MRIGVVSDTHGSLPDWVTAAFSGVDHIIHAGDVGSSFVLDLLEATASVAAVRGNTDQSDELSSLPHHLRLKLGGLAVLVVHEPHDVRRLIAEAPADVVITGHTHRPRVQTSGEVLYVNPGSASRSRGEGHSVAILTLEDGEARASIVTD